MKPVWHIDLETRSGADLISRGVVPYARDPLASAMLFALAIDDNDPVLFDLTETALPDWVLSGLSDEGIIKTAFNAPFEIEIINTTMGIHSPVDQWMDVAALARSLSYAGGLAAIGDALGLPEEMLKQPGGRALIKRFCVPLDVPKGRGEFFHRPSDYPEEWEKFKAYNIQDVVAETAIFNRIKPYLARTYRPEEHEQWLLDQKINTTGLPIDMALVRAAISTHESHKEHLLKIARRLTGLPNPNSGVQLIAYLRDKGLNVDNIQKATVDRLLLNPELPSTVREVLKLRQQLAKASVSKFSAFADRTDETDDRLRGAFSFMGAARTGRWSGSGVQPHNLPGATVGGA